MSENVGHEVIARAGRGPAASSAALGRARDDRGPDRPGHAAPADPPEPARRAPRDPGLATGAVEEILRMAAPTLGVIARYAVADIEVGGVTIAPGDLVLVSTDADNRDDAAFAEPDRFDIRRTPNQHVAFGHGLRFCIGAGLARVELQTVFSALFQRVPTLRLAVELEELRLRDDTPLGGLTRLPVTW